MSFIEVFIRSMLIFIHITLSAFGLIYSTEMMSGQSTVGFMLGFLAYIVIIFSVILHTKYFYQKLKN